MNKPPAPPNIPDHELLTRIGRGSYGTVWLARNMMGVFRAVKIVYRNSFTNSRPFERELAGIRKFEPISRSHEGFVDVLHVGINETEGYFYYVMELGDDQSTGQKIDPSTYSPRILGKEIAAKERLSFKECLELGIALSQALAEMHKHGLVHRDVKPANIIFVNGIPKLADIGLVTDTNEANSYVGTSGFIPPEGPGTPQGDVYGLGKILYEASTGKDRQDYPELPTLLNELTDREQFLELNEVILRACKNNPTERYQGAWEMHAELLVLANGKSVKRLRILEKRFSNVKRLGAVLVVIFLLLTLLGYEVHRQKKAVSEARLRQDSISGNAAMESGDLLEALPYFADAIQVHPQDKTLRARFGSVLAQTPKLTFFGSESKELTGGTFSPDGTNILIAQDWGEVKIYNLQTRKLYLHPFGPKQCLSSAAYSHDGKSVVTTSEDGHVSIWETAALTETRHWDLPNIVVLNARFSPDDNLLAAACADGKALIWKVHKGDILLKLSHRKPVHFIDFSPDGKRIVTCCDDGFVRIWDAMTGAPVGVPMEHQGWIYRAAFSHDGKRLVTASGDHRARVWDLENFTLISKFLTHGDAVMSATFSPDNRLIMTASLDGTSRFWRSDDFTPFEPISVINVGARVADSEFDEEGRRIISTCTDGSVRVWDLAGLMTPTSLPSCVFNREGTRFLCLTNDQIKIADSGNPDAKAVICLPTFSVYKANFNRNGRFVVAESTTQTQTSNRFVQVFESKTGKTDGDKLSLNATLTRAALSDDGLRLVAFEKKEIQIWNVGKGEPLPVRLPRFEHDISDAFFSPDGTRLLVMSGKAVHVLDVMNGSELFSPLFHSQPVTHAEYNKEGSLVLTCCADATFNPGYAEVWNASNGKPVGSKLMHKDGVLFAAWSPDNRRIGTASEDFTACIWDAGTGKKLSVLKHKEKVASIAFSVDGKWVVTASVDKTARVWNSETGNPITPPLAHTDQLMEASFLENENRVLTRDRKDRSYFWDLPIDIRSPHEITSLANLLSAKDSAGSEQITDSALQDQRIWMGLQSSYPGTFGTSTENVIAWHESLAQKSEGENDWFAAGFHLGWLIKLHDPNSTIQERLSQAQTRLAHR